MQQSHFNRNLNFNFKLIKTSTGASPHLRLPICGQFEVEVEVEVEVEKSTLSMTSDLRFTRMRLRRGEYPIKCVILFYCLRCLENRSPNLYSNCS
jgi:hypothetical protein